MKKFFKKLQKGQKGFTLIELLVVIAILGTLAGIVALNVGGFIGRGHDQAACTERHQVQTAVLAYMAENNGTVPTLAQAETYIVGGVLGTYTIGAGDGLVTQTAYDGGAACTN